MLLTDKNLRIKIKSLLSQETLSFKAYVEKSEITYEMQEQSIEFAPLNFDNEFIATRVMQNLNLVFSVVAEHHEELYYNYRKLHRLIEFLKPRYIDFNGQYLPDQANTFGLIEIDFGLLPIIKTNANGKKIKLHTKNFSYNIIEDLGVFNGNFSNKKKSDPEGLANFVNFKSVNSKNSAIVPLGYKITLGGRILLNINDASSAEDKAPTGGSKKAGTSVDHRVIDVELKKLQITPQQKVDFIAIYSNLTNGKALYGDRDTNKIIQRYKSIKSLINDRLINNTGEKIYDINPDGTSVLEETKKHLEESYKTKVENLQNI